MTKQELSWLLIRVAGVLLIVAAITYLLELLQFVYLYRASMSMLTSGNDPVFPSLTNTSLAQNAEQMSRIFNTSLYLFILKIFVCLSLGLYLLNGGTFIFYLLSYEPKTESSR